MYTWVKWKGRGCTEHFLVWKEEGTEKNDVVIEMGITN